MVSVKGWGFRVLCWGLRGVGFGVKGIGLRLQGFVQIKGVWLRL